MKISVTIEYDDHLTMTSSRGEVGHDIKEAMGVVRSCAEDVLDRLGELRLVY